MNSPFKYNTLIKGYEHYADKDPLQKLVDIWIEKRIHTAKPSTIRNYRLLFNNVIRFFKRKPVERWTQEDMANLIHFLLNKEGQNPNYVRLQLRCLRFVLLSAVDDGLLHILPFEWRRIPKVAKAKVDKVPFTYDQYRAVQEEFKKDVYRLRWFPDAMAIGWHTGLRIGDIATMKRSLVDLQANIITNHTMKKSRQREVLEIPIEPDLQTVLARLLTAPLDYPSEFVLPNMHFAYYNERREIIQEFRDACDACGLKKHSFHSLRHSYVSRLLNAGVDSIVISALTGQSIAQIQEYAHVTVNAKVEALRKARLFMQLSTPKEVEL